MRTTIITLFFLALFTSASGALAVDLPIKTDSSYVSPATVDGATTIDAAKAHELWKERAWFVDPRKPGQYESTQAVGRLMQLSELLREELGRFKVN